MQIYIYYVFVTYVSSYYIPGGRRTALAWYQGLGDRAVWLVLANASIASTCPCQEMRFRRLVAMRRF